MNTTVAIIVAVIAVLAIAGLMMGARKHRAARLRSKFGPEYERAVEEAGSRAKAQAHLIEREQRVKKFAIRPLTAEERDHFEPAWRDVQAQFVENPEAAISAADDLLGELMAARGYPVGEFAQRAADLSVDHPRVVHHYRAAHDIVMKHEAGELDGDTTEQLRQSMLDYRELYDELMKAPANDTAEAPPREEMDRAS